MLNKERLVDTFLELVQIDSETGHEREIADHLTQVMTDLGYHVIEDDSQKDTGFGAGNLIINIEGDESRKPIYFSCHMDTVTPGQGVKPVIKDDIIYSDGTTILGADDKAGVAVLLETLTVIKEENLAHGPLQIVISVGEESQLVGAKAFDAEYLTSEFGYALDSGNEVGTIVTAAPSQAKLEVHITGKTAHAGLAPEEGISAINIAAKAVSRMTLGRIDAETTANIGRFEGGTVTNIVADSCFILAEARSLDQGKLDQQVAHMKETFEQTAAEMGGSAEVQVTPSYPAFNVAEDSEVVQIAKQAAENVGLSPVLKKSGGGSDANIFNGFGVPTLVLAVGYQDIHTKQEKMPISELVKLNEQVLEIISLV
ncbi:M20/M25/M40 family metallo-hydrolase [Macrococcus bovicus]|uniref:M20/M25/M40 family metallo-hydrolase n=1 Tax=Macrococcus bovicus TaxID=69968 RepID=A0A4R6C2Y0_9STAP|nr:M20/M25/M40 family metallo-hydrolase [Macrococcus bovicus]TDM15503.1 M20/M25/M40 family metallo-hydrolase [Macrococcus bovicus]WJP96894.1 M20/M25/M40 family metallo-hydrolase [Macrococcus bovicus]